MIRAEIWVGGMSNEAYRIEGVKSFETFGNICKITDADGWIFETSWNNVVIIKKPIKKGGEG